MRYKLFSWPGYPEPLVGSNQPVLLPQAKREYKLKGDYSVGVRDELGKRYRLTVSDGFISDGASIPRIFWSLSGMHPDGLIRAAALVHDRLCDSKGFIVLFDVRQPIPSRISSKDAARIFRDLMKAAGMATFSIQVAYLVVKWFGPHWK